jgi:hypothetical protein
MALLIFLLFCILFVIGMVSHFISTRIYRVLQRRESSLARPIGIAVFIACFLGIVFTLGHFFLSGGRPFGC